MKQPNRATVICIAYNHEKWVEKALNSVLEQALESPPDLIIADNGSSDQTAQVIRDWVSSHAAEISISTSYKSESIPYCKLFNELLNLAKSEFIVDLSGDDFLYPRHLALSIARLDQVPEAAFVFSDAHIGGEDGSKKAYYKRDEISFLKDKTLTRELYQTLIRRSFISSPTVVFRSQILKNEGGYDESLSYEDFDIQLRLTNTYPALFSAHVGVYKRKHSRSLSSAQYELYHSKMLPSTLRVCEKIREMNSNAKEDLALQERILHELKHALWSANFNTAQGFVSLAEQLNTKSFEMSLYKAWLYLRLDISWLYAKLT